MATPALPAGYQLDQASGPPPLPSGYQLDSGNTSASIPPQPSLLSRLTDKVGQMYQHGKAFAQQYSESSAATPYIAEQLYKHFTGQPNSLDKVPTKAAMNFLMSFAGEAEPISEEGIAQNRAAAAQAAAAKSATPPGATPNANTLTNALGVVSPKAAKIAAGIQKGGLASAFEAAIPERVRYGLKLLGLEKAGAPALESAAEIPAVQSPQFQNVEPPASSTAPAASPASELAAGSSPPPGPAASAAASPRTVVLDPETGKPEFSDVVARGSRKQKFADLLQKAQSEQAAEQATPREAPQEDLTALLQQSLDQVKARKGGVMTTADPGELTKRWGVDPESLATVVLDPETGKPEFSDVVARGSRKQKFADLLQKAQSEQAAEQATPREAPQEDLTALLQQSLDQVKARKGGVMTTADPGELTKRWGVDPESLASGREQTRGMTPDQTEDYIDKLADSYKKGRAVEPVMETRDAGNNVIDVDGRARAIAAERAGVKRIPIMIRRMATKAAAQ